MKKVKILKYSFNSYSIAYYVKSTTFRGETKKVTCLFQLEKLWKCNFCSYIVECMTIPCLIDKKYTISLTKRELKTF